MLYYLAKFSLSFSYNFFFFNSKDLVLEMYVQLSECVLLTEETHRTCKHAALGGKQEATQTGPCCLVHSSFQVIHTRGWMKCQEIGKCRERKGKVEIDSSRESRKGSCRGRIGTALGGRVSGAIHFKEWNLS